MAATMLKDDRKNALNAAESAVNAYAKDPTDKNAAKVQSAWETVKDLQATPIWRQRLESWLRSYPGSDDDLK